jgi:hypothetical protein
VAPSLPLGPVGPVGPNKEAFVAFLVVPVTISTKGITSVSSGVPNVNSDIFLSADKLLFV